jgi:hypothetical protein
VVDGEAKRDIGAGAALTAPPTAEPEAAPKPNGDAAKAELLNADAPNAFKLDAPEPNAEPAAGTLPHGDTDDELAGN